MYQGAPSNTVITTTPSTTKTTSKTPASTSTETETPSAATVTETPAATSTTTSIEQEAAAAAAQNAAEEEARRAQKAALQREMHETAIRTRQDAATKAKSMLVRLDLQPIDAPLASATTGDPFVGLSSLIQTLGSYNQSTAAPVQVDPCAGVMAYQCKKAARKAAKEAKKPSERLKRKPEKKPAKKQRKEEKNSAKKERKRGRQNAIAPVVCGAKITESVTGSKRI